MSARLSPGPGSAILSRGAMYLLGAICSEVTGTLSLKGAIQYPWLYMVVVSGYLLSFLMLSSALRHGVPLGVAYGIWSALGVVFATLFAMLLFGEHISLPVALGMVLIVVGVVFVETGSSSHDHDSAPQRRIGS